MFYLNVSLPLTIINFAAGSGGIPVNLDKTNWAYALGTPLRAYGIAPVLNRAGASEHNCNTGEPGTGPSILYVKIWPSLPRRVYVFV